MALNLDEIGVAIVGKFDELTAALGGAAEATSASMTEIKEQVSSMATTVDERMAAAGESMSAFGDAMSHISELLIAGFAVDKIVGMVNKTAEAAQQFKLLSETTGVSTDALQGLKFAGDQVGVGWDQMSRALVVLNHNMLMARESTSGTSIQLETFSMVGLNRAALESMTTAQALATIADKFKSVSDPSQKAGIAMALFGRAGAQLVPLLNEGSSGIAALTEKARSLGVIMSGQSIDAAAAYAVQLKDMKAAATGLEQEFSIKLMPLFSQVTSQMEESSAEAQKNSGALDALKNAITGIVIVLEALWSAIHAIIDAGHAMVSTLVDGFSNIGTVISDVVHGQFKQAYTDARASSHEMFEDMKSGLDDLASHFDDTWKHIGAMAAGESAKVGQQAKDAMAGGEGDGGAGGFSAPIKQVGGGFTEKKLPDISGSLAQVEALQVSEKQSAAEFAAMQVNAARAAETVQTDFDNAVKSMDKILEPITKGFDQTITGVIRGTQTWHQGMVKILGSIEEEFLSTALHMAAHWAAMELAKTAASVTGDQIRTTSAEWAADRSTLASVGSAIKTIGAKAWQAAAAVYADVSEIPFVGWILAPLMAIAAAVEVAGFVGRIASAAGGWENVPHDQMAMVHKEEMVLPAPVARAARRTFSGGGGGGNTIHISALDSRSFADALRRNPQALTKGIKHAGRMGSL